MKRFLIILALALGGCIPVPVVPTEKVVIKPATTDFGRALVTFRAENGVHGIMEDATLARVATQYAQTMQAQGRFTHIGSDGSRPWTRAWAGGYCDTSLVGENIGKGYKSEQAVLAGWENSPGHRENMLDSRFIRFGLGHVGEYWVLLLGGAC